jgi:hypothetical protein
MLSVFANFRIDSNERFNRLKDSFLSFKDCDIDNWVINIRGNFKNEVAIFLSENIISTDIQITYLESPSGWIFDSLRLVDSIKNDYVFFWIEDHILTNKTHVLDEVVLELRLNKIDHLHYSWFHFGKNINIFKLNNFFETKNLLYKNLKFLNNLQWQFSTKFHYNNYNYLVSCCSISSKNFFIKILECRTPFVKRWPSATPFDFEKRPFDFDILPATIAVPKKELFASIDDDHGQTGYSLISRGKYIKREDRSITSPIILHENKFLRKIISIFFYIYLLFRDLLNSLLSVIFYFKKN